MSAAALRAEILAQPAGDRLSYALDLLEFYLDPVPAFYSGLADLGLDLTAQEARILYALDRRRGRLVSADSLLAAAMGSRPIDDWPEARAVIARVANLRAKLAARSLPVTIDAWLDLGYRLTAPQGFAFGVERPFGRAPL